MAGFDNKMGYNTSGNPIARRVVKDVLGDAKNEKDRNLPKLGGNNTPLQKGNALMGKNRTGFNKMVG